MSDYCQNWKLKNNKMFNVVSELRGGGILHQTVYACASENFEIASIHLNIFLTLGTNASLFVECVCLDHWSYSVDSAVTLDKDGLIE